MQVSSTATNDEAQDTSVPEVAGATKRSTFFIWVLLLYLVMGTVWFYLPAKFLHRFTKHPAIQLTDRIWEFALLAIGFLLLTVCWAAVAALLSRKAALVNAERYRLLQERYRLLMGSVTDAVLVYPIGPDDLPGQFLVANEAACRLLGYTTAELLRFTPVQITVATDTQLAMEQGPLKTMQITKERQRVPVEIMIHKDTFDGKTTMLMVVRDLREGNRYAQELRDTGECFRALLHAVPQAVISLDQHGQVLAWDATAQSMFGWRETEILGAPLPTVPPEELRHLTMLWLHAKPGDQPIVVETTYCAKDDTMVAVSASIAPTFSAGGELTGIMCVVSDISRSKYVDEELRWLKRTNAMLIEAKRAIARATEEPALLQDVCRAIVETGGYRLAWVGFPTEDTGKTLTPVAWAGPGEGYLESATFSWAGNSPNIAPPGLAMREGKIIVKRNLLLAQPKSEPWLVETLNRGCGSIIALPLSTHWQPLGVLVIYTESGKGFPPREVESLTELADNLMYGIESLRVRVKREQAEGGLLAAAQQWRATFDAISDPLFVVDADGCVVRGNNAAVKLFGKSHDEIVNLRCNELIHGIDNCPEKCLLRHVKNLRHTESEALAIGDRWFRVTIDPLFDERGAFQGAIHLMDDITDYRRTEEELQQNYERLESVLDNTIAAIAKIVEMRDPYTAGHERRVSQLSCAIGRVMGLPERQVEGLRVGGMLHDIGKLYVPSEMLSKPTMLSEIEYDLIRNHANAGHEILKTVNFPWPVAEMAYQHHERLDGSGYPNGISGEKILLEARIIAVADVVESMASHRPYRPARGIDSALEEISTKSGALYDPAVVEACLEVFKDRTFTLE
ncbi:MAG: HD domain-containing phosphohydrolase [Armatimonadota bacterium]